jgi:hypothetical protein
MLENAVLSSQFDLEGREIFSGLEKSLFPSGLPSVLDFFARLNAREGNRAIPCLSFQKELHDAKILRRA